ncbi:MAG: two-component regulator propeller domain-containing protein, partial [Pricia sp.]
MMIGHKSSWCQKYTTQSFENVTYYTSNDGLSHNEVTSIIKDKTGFLWIGTRGGLNCFDGTEFKVYDTEIGNKNSLIGSSIESLYEDAKGQIWIGTKTNGISVYNPVHNKFTHFNSASNGGNYIQGERIISITEGLPG